MKESLLIGISYCGTHNKGEYLDSPGAVRVSPVEHAEWLLATVRLWQKLAVDLDRASRVVVTATGLPAMLQVTAPGERDVMWAVLDRAIILAHPDNPGHQVGASIALRQGLEAAGYWGYPLYLHTAEDILPWPGSVEKLLAALDGGSDYAGYCWTDMLNCQFFGCRTAALAGCFDMEGVRNFPGLEHYLHHLLKDRPKSVSGDGGRGHYLTTHDWRQFQGWLKKMPDSTAPKVIRTAQDYEKPRPWFEGDE